MNSSKFYCPRYSELSDDIRAKNKREDRLLDIRLKYYERQKKTCLQILSKQQHQVERTRIHINEQLWTMYDEKRQSLIALPLNNKHAVPSSTSMPQSTLERLRADSNLRSTVDVCDRLPSMLTDHVNTSSSIVRPHSAR
jgi:hypothetical protein